MAYERPRGLHETTYTRGEELFHLARQLFLLREGLVRTAHNPTYYPELFRALRVLVVDGHRGRLGDLAEHLGVIHTVPSILSNVPPEEPSQRRGGPDEWRDLRFGLTSMMFMNPCSRWLELRKMQIEAPEPCKETDFWAYLEDEIVSNKAEYGGPMSRMALIAETANTRDVVHASRNYPTFLQGAQAWAMTGPYFLEVAQDVAYEALLYGRRVLEAGREGYKEEIAQAVRFEMPIPSVACGSCRRPVDLEQFKCPHCGTELLPEPRMLSLKDSLSSIFHHSRIVDDPEGTFSVYLSVSAIHRSPLQEIELLEVAGNNAEMRLTRTGDDKLVWEVIREGKSLTAAWPVGKSPALGRSTFFLMWTPVEVSITSTTADGALIQVSSDGTCQPITEAEGEADPPELG